MNIPTAGLRPAHPLRGSWNPGAARHLLVRRLRARLARAAGFVALLGAAALAGCDKAAPPPAPPSPVEVTADATGHYCGMLLVDHEGPKGQIFVAGREQPVWFSSVRETIAFLRLPEEPRDITAVYVNDMGKSAHWQQPDRGAWVEARDAWFVVDSARRGGMGAPEAVPFSQQSAAQAFREAHGGRVVRLAEIPDAYLFGAVDSPDRPAAVDTPASDAPHR